MNHITIELCTEDRARLDTLIMLQAELLKTLNPENPQNIATVPTQAEIDKMVAIDLTEEETPKTGEFEPNKNATQDTEAPAVTVEDIRSKVLALTAAGKKDELKAIIKEYAPKVSEIPADKLAEVFDKLSKLEG